jgi:hypothetical protein
MDEHGRARWAMGALGALPIVLGGCVAQIRETPLYGPSRTTPDTRWEVTTQRQAGVGGAIECRDVTVASPMVRDVEVRRSFADGAQEVNGAVAMLIGTALGFLQYGQSQVQCPGTGPGCPALTPGSFALLGLAAIPVTFLAYNALRVQDSRTVERVTPEEERGPWHPCAE